MVGVPDAGPGYDRVMSTEVEQRSAALGTASQRARAAWPGIAVDEARFAGHLRAVLDGRPDDAVVELHVEDLYLAWACLEGNPEALAAFDARMAPVVAAVWSRLRIDPARGEDLAQDLRVRLVVGTAGGPGKLAQYRGRGRLAHWLRAAAMRAAYRSAGQARPYLALDEAALAGSDSLGLDPALLHLKERCRLELKSALAAALAALPRRERLLLKQHYLDRLTIEDVAALYRIHRSSAARWLAQARETLAAAALQDFRARLGVAEHEVESLVELVRSQLDITVERLLSATQSAPAAR